MVLDTNRSVNILIIGTGILGLTIAKKLLDSGCDNISIIEKEICFGAHASGRSSGVLHAGIYYGEDSLKAKFCLKGNQLMQSYCLERGLPLENSGKVIVTGNHDELVILNRLYSQAKVNGADVEIIDSVQLGDIEPSALTVSKALFSKSTATIDPNAVLKSIYDELIASKKVTIQFNTKYLSLKGENTAVTSKGSIKFEKLVNVSGSYSDKVAHSFGIAKDLVAMPFKGVYFKLKKTAACRVNGNIYPVPDIRNPFLGVHFTRNISGDIYLGPTAIPCFGRENYKGLKGVGFESFNILSCSAKLFLCNKKFRTIALSEPRKYLKKYFYNDAKKLVKHLDINWLESTPKVGIRPQLVNRKTNELVMDFVVQNTSNSYHLLNAISPAFTSSFALSEHIVDQYILGG